MFLHLKRAGCPKVGEEFITEAHNEEPDIPSHLRSCNEKAPRDEEEGSVKEVVNISEPFQMLFCFWDPSHILFQ